ncbi:MAG TPA: hypothetical protein VIK91_28685, partial [Nannocystis sp.]
MRRDLRELAALTVLGLGLGLAHLALRPDLAWFPAPAGDEGMCGLDLAGDPGVAPASTPAASTPAAPLTPAEPLASFPE